MMGTTRISRAARNSTSLSGVALITGMMSLGFAEPAAAANATYEICVRVQNVSEAGTDDSGLYARLIGLRNESQAFILDTPGVDDLNRGTVSCFQQTIPDIGHVNRLHLNMTQNDDICIDSVTVSRRVLGVIKGKSQFRDRVCLGDDARSRDHWFEADNQEQALTASRPVGSWEFVCSGICNEELATQLTNTTTNSTESSSAVTTAISSTLNAGIEFEGASLGASVTSSEERTAARASRQELSKANQTSSKRSVIISLGDMQKFGIDTVWRWVVTTRMSNGQTIKLSTSRYTCTPNSFEPTYVAGSPKGSGACTTPVGSQGAAPQANYQQQQPNYQQQQPNYQQQQPNYQQQQPNYQQQQPNYQQQQPNYQQQQPNYQQQQPTDATQLAALLGVSVEELTQFVQELNADGYGNDAIEFILTNEIAAAAGEPYLTEDQVDARLEAMGYEFVD